MKIKLLLFFGLAIASASLMATFSSTPTHATDEKYIWTGSTTIQASGGKYRGTTTFTVTSTKKISGSTTELVANDINIDATYGDCDHTIGRISFSNNSKTSGSLWMGDLAAGTQTSCGTYPASEQSMDGTINVAAQAIPPVNYNTVDCTTYKTTDGIEQCKALKKCVVDEKKSANECTDALSTCLTNHTVDGGITEAAKDDCVKKIAAGDLAAATAPVATDSKTTCAVVGVGWIICPVVSFLAQLVDASYGFVSSLLFVQPLLSASDSSAGIYSAWSVMRNFANVAFVIAFLVIIFSQLTSVGITNYGIKKMLPRIIVSAILVNVSYWLCAAAIDVSNITGASINQVLQNVKDGLSLPNSEDWGATGAGLDGWAGISGAVLAGTIATGVVLYIGLSALLPALIAVLLVIITVFLVLTLRQALIILLVVVAPLAFVARLLPNTESLYKKWFDLGKVLLVMYPVIGLIFGASALASTVVMGTASGDYKIAIQIMGAAVAVLPLIVVPTLIKTTSGVLGRFGAIVNNPNKGPFDAMKKGAEGFRANRQQLRDARALNGGPRFGGSLVRRNARRKAVLGQRERNYNNAKAGYIAEESLSNDITKTQQALSWATAGDLGGKTKGEQMLSNMAKGGGPGARSAALAQAVSVQAKIEAEEVTAASAVIKHMNLDRNQQAMRELSMGGQSNGLNGANSAVRAAAMKNVVDSHDVEGVNQLLDNVGTMSVKTREAFADSLANSSQKPEYVGQGAISNIRQHGEVKIDPTTGAPMINPVTGRVMTVEAANSTELTVEAINNNTYSVDKLATGDKDELAHVARIAANPANGTNNASLKANAITAKTDPRYSGRISKNAAVVDTISRL